jgi:hypothetical protein
MKAIRVGHTVMVKRDIYRVSNQVYTQLDIYARKGMLGVVVEVFKSGSSGNPRNKILFAKVDNCGTIYTFRLTSLERVYP